MTHAATLFDPQNESTSAAWHDGPQMTEALSRLARAFDRLEQAVETLKMSPDAAGHESLHGQIAALRADNAQLIELLTERDGEVSRLSELNAAVSDRLESSIQSLRTILEE